MKASVLAKKLNDFATKNDDPDVYLKNGPFVIGTNAIEKKIQEVEYSDFENGIWVDRKETGIVIGIEAYNDSL
jgi:uncharacterized protein YuzE